MIRRQAAVQGQETVNSALLNVITPIGLEFTKNGLSVGENIGKVYGLIHICRISWRSSSFRLSSASFSMDCMSAMTGEISTGRLTAMNLNGYRISDSSAVSCLIRLCFSARKSGHYGFL